ncbi:MAG: glycerate kinase [Thermoleophilia bacterium]|nr:glycerate kinase [Thermoleophilia bacterium]
MDLRGHAMKIIEAALAAVEPGKLTRQALAVSGGGIDLDGYRLDLSRVRDIYLLGMGKAAATMARGAESVLKGRISAGLVVVKDGYGVPGLKFTEVVEAAHPLPEERNIAAARRVLELAERADEDSLVIFLVSGGSSALLTLPAPGVSLEDLRRVTEALLKSGAAIGEINAVRKHITGVGGGRLAAAAAPARVLTLIVSDVIGDRLDVIASGPTVPDRSTFAEALAVLRKYNLFDELPEIIPARLQQGIAGTIDETPKPGDPVFARAHARIIASNRNAVDAAARAAGGLGYEVTRMKPLLGEARVRGKEFAELVRRQEEPGKHGFRPACVIAGGETTVAVRGPGAGGRAQEFALAAALEMEGLRNSLIFGFGTDGTDGPTEAAGAFADGSTLARARAAGLDPARHLAQNDAYPLFAALDDLIVTGPTGTNVNDIYCALMHNPDA